MVFALAMNWFLLSCRLFIEICILLLSLFDLALKPSHSFLQFSYIYYLLTLLLFCAWQFDQWTIHIFCWSNWSFFSFLLIIIRLDFNKSTLYPFTFLSCAKLYIVHILFILWNLCYFILIFHFFEKVIVFGSWIKQAYHHMLTNNIRHMLFHFLLYLFQS